MKRSFMMVFAAVLLLVPIAVVGCKGRVDKEADMASFETTEAFVPMEDVVVTQSPLMDSNEMQIVGEETIPPTAAVPPVSGTSTTAGQDNFSRNKEMQTALKAAGFYTGSIDGKVGPKTKRAIIEFQKAKGLKPDGKVGPKTWVELEKYLTTQ